MVVSGVIRCLEIDIIELQGIVRCNPQENRKLENITEKFKSRA
jgi:hypothetical protein